MHKVVISKYVNQEDKEDAEMLLQIQEHDEIAN